MVTHRSLLTICLVAAVTTLAACDNSGSAGAFGTPPDAAVTGNTMEFRGARPCVDCQGIEAWLRLEQRGADRRYTLVEIYRANGNPRKFEDAGSWASSGDLLRLRSAEGGERVYALLPDNRLQAVDTRGRPLSALEDEVLVPTTYSNER